MNGFWGTYTIKCTIKQHLHLNVNIADKIKFVFSINITVHLCFAHEYKVLTFEES